MALMVSKEIFSTWIKLNQAYHPHRQSEQARDHSHVVLTVHLKDCTPYMALSRTDRASSCGLEPKQVLSYILFCFWQQMNEHVAIEIHTFKMYVFSAL